MSPYIAREAKIVRITATLRDYPDCTIALLLQAPSLSDDERRAIEREQLRRTIFEVHARRKAS